MLAASPLQQLHHPYATDAGVSLYCKRDDLYAWTPGSPLQGNKVRKLTPFLSHSLAEPGRTVVSFGGPYSNHLAALAAAGRRFGFATQFFVRGEEVRNPTLAYIRRSGTELRFISRSDYRRKHDPDFQASLGLPDDHLIIPEGGSTLASLNSVGAVFRETIEQLGYAPDYFCLSAGTGCSAAGVLRAAAGTPTRLEVFPALRGDWMRTEIERWLDGETGGDRLSVIPEFTFGGYGRFPGSWRLHTPPGSIAKRADIGQPGLPPLEPVYTAKLFSGVLERLRSGQYARGATLVVWHTGGIY